MRREELKEILSSEIQGIVAGLIRGNHCPDDWAAIGYRRGDDEVLVSVGYEPDHAIRLFSVPKDEWPKVEPWWMPGSAFPTSESA